MGAMQGGQSRVEQAVKGRVGGQTFAVRQGRSLRLPRDGD